MTVKNNFDKFFTNFREAYTATCGRVLEGCGQDIFIKPGKELVVFDNVIDDTHRYSIEISCRKDKTCEIAIYYCFEGFVGCVPSSMTSVHKHWDVKLDIVEAVFKSLDTTLLLQSSFFIDLWETGKL